MARQEFAFGIDKVLIVHVVRPLVSFLASAHSCLYPGLSALCPLLFVFSYVVMFTEVLHAVFVMAITRAAVPELRHRIIVLGNTAYGTPVYRAFLQRSIE